MGKGGPVWLATGQARPARVTGRDRVLPWATEGLQLPSLTAAAGLGGQGCVTAGGLGLGDSVSPSLLLLLKIVCCCSVSKSCSTLCDPMDCSMPGFPVLHCLLEFTQTHVIPSNHLILCHPLLFLPSIFPSIRIFSSSTTIRKHQFLGPQPSLCSSSHIHTWLLGKP